jgi:S1-C subfamily serine protease
MTLIHRFRWITCRCAALLIIATSLIGCSNTRTVVSTSEEIVSSSEERVFIKHQADKQLYEIASHIEYPETSNQEQKSDGGSALLVLKLTDVRKGYLYDVNKEVIKKIEKSTSPGTSMNRLIVHSILIGIALPFDLMTEEGRKKLFLDYEESVETLENQKIIGKTDEYVTRSFPGNGIHISLNYDGKTLENVISDDDGEVTVPLINLLDNVTPAPTGDLKLSANFLYQGKNFTNEIVILRSDLAKTVQEISERQEKKAAEERERIEKDKREAKRKEKLEELGIFDLKPTSTGSGFFINQKGHMITNAHVINGCKAITFLQDSREAAATVTSTDQMNDLAILKSRKQVSRQFVPIRQSSPKIGEQIYAIGFPLSNLLGKSPKVTSGIISALSGLGGDVSKVQVDAALQSGNSGGPIVDTKGRLVAVSVQKLGKAALAFLKDSGEIPENVNFGIKNLTVKTMLNAHKVRYSSDNIGDLNATIDSTVHITCWTDGAKPNTPNI